MDILPLISALVSKIGGAGNSGAQSGQSQQQGQQQQTVQKAFKQLLQSEKGQISRPNQPETPTQPKQPDVPARLQLGRHGFGQHRFYNAQGNLFRLAQFPNEAMLLRQQLMAQKPLATFQEQAAAMVSQLKMNDTLVATYLQQGIQILKEHLKKEDRDKKRKRGDADEESKDKEGGTEAEEGALEMLDILFGREGEMGSPAEFAEWAYGVIDSIEQELDIRAGQSLPDSVKKRFSIMRDAVQAVEFGVDPQDVMNTLEAAIKNKS